MARDLFFKIGNDLARKCREGKHGAAHTLKRGDSTSSEEVEEVLCCVELRESCSHTLSPRRQTLLGVEKSMLLSSGGVNF